MGVKKGEVIKALLLIKEIKINESYHYRSHQSLLQTAIKVGVFCKSDRIGYVEYWIEKLGAII